MKAHRLTLLLLIAFLLFSACSKPAAPGPAQVPAPDYWPTQGWRTTTPEEQGLDSGKLAEMFDAIADDSLNLHSLLVIRNGYIVLEAYADPYGPDVRHTVESNTKSVVGSLIGIAIAQGKIASADAKMVDLFPERMLQNLTERKESIRIKDLLSMTSGLDCADQTPAAQQMYASSDWVGYLLDLPVTTEPGKQFAYCSGGVHLLSAALQDATGSSAREFANQNLFKPLGIPEVSELDWASDPKGISNGIAGLYLTPRELAKFGFLYLHRGAWDGQQVAPAGWVDESTRGQIGIGKSDYTAGLDREFGYLFSLFPDQKFYGYLGMAGQDMFVAPEQNLVVVINSGLKVGEEGRLLKLMTEFILPAVKSTSSLRANLEAQDRLADRLQRFNGPGQPVQPLPPLASEINDRVYQLEENPYGWKTIAFSFPEKTSEAIVTVDGAVRLPVGLDGRYRLTAMPNARPVGLRGGWASADTVKLDYITLGDFNELIVQLKFSGDELTVSVQARSYDNPPVVARGKAQK